MDSDSPDLIAYQKITK